MAEDREKARRELEELTPVEAAQQAAVEQVGVGQGGKNVCVFVF